MRRWRRGQWGVVEGWAPPQKISFLCVQNDKFGCILPQRVIIKQAENTEALGHGCYSSMFNRIQRQRYKNYLKIQVRPRGRSHYLPP